MKRLCFLLTIGFISVQLAFGCTVSGRALSKFDDDEYIFIGVVVGYTNEVGFDEKRRSSPIKAISATPLNNAQTESQTVGLVLKVKGSVYLPQPGSEFEVFQYDLLSDCSLSGQTLPALEKKFPINSEVRVIAKNAILLTSPSVGKTRLEDRPDEQGQVVLNFQSDKRLTTNESLFNYAGYKFDIDKDTDSKYLLPSFEARKDLLRLIKAVTQRERDAILKRLFDAPSTADIDFLGVLKLYSVNETQARSTFEAFLKTKDPEAFEAYKIWEKAVADLMKLGYQRSEAERAMRMAFDEGTFLDSKDLLQKCVEILNRNKNTEP